MELVNQRFDSPERTIRNLNPSPNSSLSDDPYSRVDYRRIVGFPQRIQRESSFLIKTLTTAPNTRIIDLGCGTGEHCRYLSSQGFWTLGLDRSMTMLDKAMEKYLPPNLNFIQGELKEVSTLVNRSFGAAICLGNTLVHLTERAELEKTFTSLAKILETNAIFLFQILNYEPIFEGRVRYLPINFRRDKDGKEAIFLRIMEPLSKGWINFCPSTLQYDAMSDPPLQIVKSRTIKLRGWRRKDLEPLLEHSGFQIESIHGGMEFEAFQTLESQDLVVITRKR